MIIQWTRYYADGHQNTVRYDLADPDRSSHLREAVETLLNRQVGVDHNEFHLITPVDIKDVMKLEEMQ